MPRLFPCFLRRCSIHLLHKLFIMQNSTTFYEVSYTKKIGGEGRVTVKARNEAEAISNAKFNVFTGKDFKVIGEVAATKNTVKGPGHNRIN